MGVYKNNNENFLLTANIIDISRPFFFEKKAQIVVFDPSITLSTFIVVPLCPLAVKSFFSGYTMIILNELLSIIFQLYEIFVHNEMNSYLDDQHNITPFRILSFGF